MIAIYARVSTDEQVKNGYSLQDQIRECRKLTIDDDIIEYVDEGISGEVLERPALTQLRTAVKKGLITKIICLDPDRLSRKLMNQLIISDEFLKKTELLFVNGSYAQTAEGNLFYQLRGAISEFEKAKIIERTSRGRREKARQGKVVRNYLIYGYDFDKSTNMLVINQAEAQVIIKIFHMFTYQDNLYQGINGIANFLNENGIKTKRGAPLWHRQVVRQILMNKTYIGTLYQNVWNSEGMYMNRYRDVQAHIPLKKRPEKEWIAAICPKIIDDETFNFAQELLNQSRRRWAGNLKSKYLLSGLVRCGLCGNSMTGRKSKNWGKYKIEYAELKSAKGPGKQGCGNKLSSSLLDYIVWLKVSTLLSKTNFLSQLFSGTKNEIIEVNLEEYKMCDLEEHKLNIEEENSEKFALEDKQTLIRRTVSEIRVYKDVVKIYLF